MMAWLLWYLASLLLGWLAFPIAYRLLPGLKDRGYTACRILGLLIWGYGFWALASLGMLPFNLGGLLLAAALLAGLSLWAASGIPRRELWEWLASQRRLVIASELLFLACFAGWAVVRAANPEAQWTEKPMELAFINAILRSRSFPPHDPWLSGHSISYYHFGYVLVAMLAKLTGTTGGVAFNLGIVLVFALSASGAYGVVYNLLNSLKNSRERSAPAGPAAFTLASLLGPFFVLVVSNLEGFLDVLHKRGFFWSRLADGSLASPFWRWLDLQELNAPPVEPFSWLPTRTWWWWRASRVLQDYDLRGASKEIIDEFPFFSYLLADLHPHVLAMPFAFLAILLALNLYLEARPAHRFGGRLRLSRGWLQGIAVLCVPGGLAAAFFGLARLRTSLLGLGMVSLILAAFLLWKLYAPDGEQDEAGASKRAVDFTFNLQISPAFFLLSAIALGAMAFLNIWDFPVYVFFFATGYALRGYLRGGASYKQSLTDLVSMGAAVGLFGVVLYLPFYLGFSSQAGGGLPNLVYPTRGAHLWVMFAPLLVPIFAWLLFQQARNRSGISLGRSFGLSAGLLLVLWVLALLLGLAITFIPERGLQFLSSVGAESSAQLLQAALQRRLASPGGWLTLLILLGLVLACLPRLQKPAGRSPQLAESMEADPQIHPQAHPPVDPADIFVILLIFTGLALVLVPEFIYLLDMFGWRMNTIFKFYYQAWLLWSLAAAACTILLLLRLKGWPAAAFRLIFSLVTLASLVYPALSLWTKTNGFQPNQWTLDSTAYFALSSPDENAAIDWLKRAPYGTVAEAVPPTGGSYSEYARVSTLSGLPAVLGWVGHENQWRGGGEAQGTRQTDLERLYCTRDWDEARLILDQYRIRYVFVGTLEQNAYVRGGAQCPLGLVEEKFEKNMLTAFQSGRVLIYENPDTASYETNEN